MLIKMEEKSDSSEASKATADVEGTSQSEDDDQSSAYSPTNVLADRDLNFDYVANNASKASYFDAFKSEMMYSKLKEMLLNSSQDNDCNTSTEIQTIEDIPNMEESLTNESPGVQSIDNEDSIAIISSSKSFEPEVIDLTDSNSELENDPRLETKESSPHKTRHSRSRRLRERRISHSSHRKLSKLYNKCRSISRKRKITYPPVRYDATTDTSKHNLISTKPVPGSFGELLLKNHRKQLTSTVAADKDSDDQTDGMFNTEEDEELELKRLALQSVVTNLDKMKNGRMTKRETEDFLDTLNLESFSQEINEPVDMELCDSEPEDSNICPELEEIGEVGDDMPMEYVYMIPPPASFNHSNDISNFESFSMGQNLCKQAIEMSASLGCPPTAQQQQKPFNEQTNPGYNGEFQNAPPLYHNTENYYNNYSMGSCYNNGGYSHTLNDINALSQEDFMSTLTKQKKTPESNLIRIKPNESSPKKKSRRVLKRKRAISNSSRKIKYSKVNVDTSSGSINANCSEKKEELPKEIVQENNNNEEDEQELRKMLLNDLAAKIRGHKMMKDKSSTVINKDLSSETLPSINPQSAVSDSNNALKHQQPKHLVYKTSGAMSDAPPFVVGNLKFPYPKPIIIDLNAESSEDETVHNSRVLDSKITNFLKNVRNSSTKDGDQHGVGYKQNYYDMLTRIKELERKKQMYASRKLKQPLDNAKGNNQNSSQSSIDNVTDSGGTDHVVSNNKDVSPDGECETTNEGSDEDDNPDEHNLSNSILSYDNLKCLESMYNSIDNCGAKSVSGDTSSDSQTSSDESSDSDSSSSGEEFDNIKNDESTQKNADCHNSDGCFSSSVNISSNSQCSPSNDEQREVNNSVSSQTSSSEDESNIALEDAVSSSNTNHVPFEESIRTLNTVLTQQVISEDVNSSSLEHPELISSESLFMLDHDGDSNAQKSTCDDLSSQIILNENNDNSPKLEESSTKMEDNGTNVEDSGTNVVNTPAETTQQPNSFACKKNLISKNKIRSNSKSSVSPSFNNLKKGFENLTSENSSRVSSCNSSPARTTGLSGEGSANKSIIVNRKTARSLPIAEDTSSKNEKLRHFETMLQKRRYSLLVAKVELNKEKINLSKIDSENRFILDSIQKFRKQLLFLEKQYKSNMLQRRESDRHCKGLGITIAGDENTLTNIEAVVSKMGKQIKGELYVIPGSSQLTRSPNPSSRTSIPLPLRKAPVNNNPYRRDNSSVNLLHKQSSASKIIRSKVNRPIISKTKFNSILNSPTNCAVTPSEVQETLLRKRLLEKHRKVCAVGQNNSSVAVNNSTSNSSTVINNSISNKVVINQENTNDNITIHINDNNNCTGNTQVSTQKILCPHDLLGTCFDSNCALTHTSHMVDRKKDDKVSAGINDARKSVTESTIVNVIDSSTIIRQGIEELLVDKKKSSDKENKIGDGPEIDPSCTDDVNEHSSVMECDAVSKLSSKSQDVKSDGVSSSSESNDSSSDSDNEESSSSDSDSESDTDSSDDKHESDEPRELE